MCKNFILNQQWIAYCQKLLRVCAIEEIYEELTRTFILAMLNQHRKDFLQTLSVEKKMAHRKQIQVKSKCKALKVSNIDYLL